MRLNPRTVLLRATALAVIVLAAAAWAKPAEKHTLWRVRSGQASIYLLGSIHALPPEAYPLAPALERVFEEAAVLVLECDLEELAAPSTQEELRRRTLLQGPGLSQRLVEGTRARFEKAVRGAGLDPALLERQKPWAVALLLGELQVLKAGFVTDRGVDRYFFGRAKEQGKPVLGLESALTPLEIFDGFTPAEQEALLASALDDFDAAQAELNELYAAWRSGDPEALARAIQVPLAREPALFRKLLTERNERWLPRIEGFLKERCSALVVVGAGHLIGEQGLVEMLRRKGYSVEQL